MKKQLITLTILISTLTGFTQPWMQLIPESKKTSPDFYTIQRAFYQYWKPFNVKEGTYYKDGKKVKAAGWKQFHRWEYLMEPRVNKDGYIPQDILKQELIKTISSKSLNKSIANWTPLGPYQVPTDIGGTSPRGNGRINTVAFHPTDPNTFWVGAPSGGIWKTTDAGNTWISVSDDWNLIGISDIAVNPIYPDTVYAATGDADAGDTWSIGILLSTDGGITWNPTGLSSVVTDYFTFRRLIINPDNPSIIIAASNHGMYRSSDAGVSWTSTMTSTNFKDAEFMPGNPNTVYAASKNEGHIYKSTDGGVSYNEITPAALTATEVARIALAVTPNNPNVVVALCANNSDNGFHSLWKSSDGGNTWTEITNSSSINLLGWQTDGQDSGGQGWYDLSLAVDPADENTIFVGGVNIWKTTDNGSSWNITAHWTGSGGAPYVHADQHTLDFNPLNNYLFSGNDGGIYYTTNLGQNWTDITSGITILQIYRMGTSQTNANINVTGAQDNGSMKRNGTTWNAILGGDGMDCLVDYSDEYIMYAEYYYGNIYKSIDGGYNMDPVNLSVAGNGAWVTPYIIDWNDHNTLYAGFDDVYKTTDGGNNWSAISSNLAGQNLNSMAVAPSNSNYLYVATYNTIWRTTNGGGFWTDISSGLPTENITSIAISDLNPLKIYVTFSGYTNGEKVYMSTDGGSSWSNFSTGLPNLPTNCITYENGTNDALYVGTDVGVYYRNATMSSWQQFSDGLPNVIVNDLEIQYSTNKLRAATYGRGMWESTLFQEAINAPVANFSTYPIEVCDGTVQFNDLSTGVPDTWLWDFGDGNTSTLQNPSHAYAALGTYTVVEIVSNSFGSDTISQNITLTSQPVIANFTVSQLIFCSAPANVDFFNSSLHASSYTWDFGDGNFSTNENPTNLFQNNGNYTVSLIANSLFCGSDTATVSIVIDPSNTITAWMPVNTSGSFTCCQGTLYDDGGPSFDYSDNNTSTIVISPSNATQIELNFASFDYETNYDYLYIYDGPSDTSPLIGAYTGSNLPNGGTITINGSSVTIKHSSDPYVIGTGFELTWSCLTVNNENKNFDEKVSIYPNPNNGMFTIYFSTITGLKKIQLLDISGRILENMETTNNKITLNSYASGIYLLKVEAAQKIYQKKIVIVNE